MNHCPHCGGNRFNLVGSTKVCFFCNAVIEVNTVEVLPVGEPQRGSWEIIGLAAGEIAFVIGCLFSIAGANTGTIYGIHPLMLFVGALLVANDILNRPQKFWFRAFVLVSAILQLILIVLNIVT